ncbi:hypothetical protein LZK52_24655, partial [Pseudomonas aeruginosa]|nr:hypothetical protein [Pseudomonas aeruginosa]
RVKPQVYAGLFPVSSDDFEDFRDASLNPNTPLTEVYGSGEVGALVCLAAMAVALLLMLAPRQAATEPSLGGHIPH